MSDLLWTTLFGWAPLPYIVIAVLIILFLISIFGNLGIDLKERKFYFGFKRRKRSCADCVEMLLSKRTIFETEYNSKLNSIIRQQMIYVERKLNDIELNLGKELSSSVKDELRRSMQENNFCDLEGLEWEQFLGDVKDTLTGLIKDKSEYTLSNIKDIYIYAKEVRSSTEKQLQGLRENFVIEIDNMIKEE